MPCFLSMTAVLNLFSFSFFTHWHSYAHCHIFWVQDFSGLFLNLTPYLMSIWYTILICISSQMTGLQLLLRTVFQCAYLLLPGVGTNPTPFSYIHSPITGPTLAAFAVVSSTLSGFFPSTAHRSHSQLTWSSLSRGFLFCFVLTNLCQIPAAVLSWGGLPA